MTSDINLLGPIVRKQGFSILGANEYDSSGTSVSGAGDINGDGYADIIIGAPYANSHAGISYIIFGQITTLCDTDLLNLTYTQKYSTSSNTGFSIVGASRGMKTGDDDYPSFLGGDESGYSVSGAGDINNDGFDDIIIGAPGANDGAGISYIIFGKLTGFTDIYLSNLTLIQGFSIMGASVSDKSGWAVSGAGDINGDGYDDVVVGAPYASPNGRTSSGISYIIFGNQTDFLGDINLANLTITQGFTIVGANVADKNGFSVSEAGDIDNDGFDDIIIGAPYAASTAGISYVIFGQKTSLNTNINLSTLDSSRGFSIIGNARKYNSGYAVSNAGDINADGYADIVIGIPGARENTGFSCVIFGKETESNSNINLDSLTISQGFFIFGEVTEGKSGWSVSGAGDINGDGYDDIIIGAPYISNNIGVSYVILGKATGLTNVYLTNLASTQGFSIFGVNLFRNSDGGNSGYSVSGAGDVNNDGIEDLLIGAPTTYSKKWNSGASYIVFGQLATSNIDLSEFTSSNIAIVGASKFDWSSYSVSGAGDVNGDGYDDIIIGAWSLGHSYIIFGNPNRFSNNIGLSSLSEIQGFRILGANPRGHNVESVSGAGDINGDGYDDIIIGTPYASINRGISYIIFGKKKLTDISLANLTLSQGFSINGAVIGDESGSSVREAGDVNGDGYDDIIIGAPYAANGAGISGLVAQIEN